MPASLTILFVHGILGKPDFFKFLVHAVPRDVDTRFITLAGHCTEPKEFGRASMAIWRRQVETVAEELIRQGRQVIIVAHSMGTLFAIQQAVAGRASGLLLLNPPLSLHLSSRLFTNPVKVLLDRIDSDDIWARAAREAYSLSADLNPIHYLRWPARYIELFCEIRRVRHIVKEVNIPSYIFYSAHDEMVAESSRRLFSGANILVDTLADSGHYYYTPADRQNIVEAFRCLLKKFGHTEK